MTLTAADELHDRAHGLYRDAEHWRQLDLPILADAYRFAGDALMEAATLIATEGLVGVVDDQAGPAPGPVRADGAYDGPHLTSGDSPDGNGSP